jgi:hypothetical protein
VRGLLRKLGEGEGDSAELTEVRVGQRGGGVMPTTEKIGGDGWSSMGVAFQARRGGDDDGNELWSWWPGVVPFYRVGEAADWVVMVAVVRFQGGGRLQKGRRRGGGVS